MKLRLMIAAMAASTALFALEPVTSENVYGVMRVSDTATTNTVVAVPWVGVDGNAVTLSNLVSTVTLQENDVVYLYEGTTWYAYKLLGSGVWDPVTTIGNSTFEQATDADKKALARGAALILQRGNTVNPVYLCGRNANTAVSTEIQPDTLTLIANPTAESKEMPVGKEGDEIRVPLNGGGLQIYSIKNGKWGTEVVTTTTQGGRTKKVRTWTEGCTLAPGKGAWYKSGATGTTINW